MVYTARMRWAVSLLALFFLFGVPVGSAQAPSSFSDSDATRVLRQVKDGIEGHNDHQVLSALDSSQMDGYLGFRDQIRSFLGQFDQIQVFFRVIQTTADGDKGTAVVEFQMEAERRNGAGMPLRRDQELRMTFSHGKKGWKLLDLQPRDYFTP